MPSHLASLDGDLEIHFFIMHFGELFSIKCIGSVDHVQYFQFPLVWQLIRVFNIAPNGSVRISANSVFRFANQGMQHYDVQEIWYKIIILMISYNLF